MGLGKVALKRKIIWGIALCVILFFLSIYYYADIAIVTNGGILFIKSIIKGEIWNFQNEIYPAIMGSILEKETTGRGYPFLFYVFWAIWDTPLYIYEEIKQSSWLTSDFALIYSKGILILFLVISMYALKKICIEIGLSLEKTGFVLFLFMMSPFTLFPIAVTTTYDIIGVTFSLFGLLYYIRNENKKFLLFFSIAIVCKYMALWIFIPLLLLREKKILRLVESIFASISLLLIPQVLFLMYNTSYGRAPVGEKLVGSIFVNYLFNNTSTLVGGGVPLIFVFSFCFWLICYFIKSEKVTGIRAIYAAFIGISIFFICGEAHPFWIMLVSPYMVLMIVRNYSIFNTNIFILNAASIGWILAKSICSPGCYAASLVKYSWLSNYFDMSKISYNIGMGGIVNKIEEVIKIPANCFLELAYALFIAAMIMFCIINFPKDRVQSKIENLVISTEHSLEYNMIYCLIVGFIVCVIPLTLFGIFQIIFV